MDVFSIVVVKYQIDYSDFFFLLHRSITLGEQLLFITLFDTTSVFETVCFLELGRIFDQTYSTLKSTQVKYTLRKLWNSFIYFFGRGGVIYRLYITVI